MAWGENRNCSDANAEFLGRLEQGQEVQVGRQILFEVFRLPFSHHGLTQNYSSKARFFASYLINQNYFTDDQIIAMNKISLHIYLGTRPDAEASDLWNSIHAVTSVPLLIDHDSSSPYVPNVNFAEFPASSKRSWQRHLRMLSLSLRNPFRVRHAEKDITPD